MKVMPIVTVAICLAITPALAKPRSHGHPAQNYGYNQFTPPGQAIPPGLAKKPYGLPPGIAKKYENQLQQQQQQNYWYQQPANRHGYNYPPRGYSYPPG